jgi:hypothetical protein
LASPRGPSSGAADYLLNIVPGPIFNTYEQAAI